MSPFPSPLAFSPLHLGKAPESKRQLLPNSKFVQPQQSAWKMAESSRKPCSGLPAQRLLSCLSLTPQPPSGFGSPPQLWGHGEVPAEQPGLHVLHNPQGHQARAAPSAREEKCIHQLHHPCPCPASCPSQPCRGRSCSPLHPALCRGLGLKKRQQRNQEEQLWCHCIPLLLLSWAGLFPGQSKL